MRLVERLRTRRASSYLLVAPVIVLALGLNLYSIGSRSLWLDETYSATLAQLGWRHMWHVILLDEANSMLYHSVLHFWMWLGTNEIALRSLSALAAAGALLPLYGLMKLLFDKEHGLLACLLFAVNAFIVQFAQEARGYALVLFLVTAASYLFVRSLRNPSSRAWMLYGIVGALSIYTHLYAVFVLMAHFLTLPFTPPRERPGQLLLRAYGVMTVLSVPLFFLFLAQGAGNIDFLERPSLLAMIGLFGELTGYGGPSLTIVYFLACCATLFTAKLLRSDARLGLWVNVGAAHDGRQGLLFLLAWLFVPIVASFIVSTYLPIYQPRYLIVAVPGLVGIASVGLMRIPKPLLVALIVVIVMLSSRGLSALYGKRIYTEDWRGATEYVLSKSNSRDGIVFEAPWVRIPFEYYTRLRGYASTRPQPIFPSPGWGQLSIMSPQFEITAKQWLRRVDVRRSRVWVVLAHQFTYGPRKRLLPIGFEREYRCDPPRLFASVTVVLCKRR